VLVRSFPALPATLQPLHSSSFLQAASGVSGRGRRREMRGGGERERDRESGRGRRRRRGRGREG
jgi:hypothetical protein